jgi:hypothetical protein
MLARERCPGVRKLFAPLTFAAPDMDCTGEHQGIGEAVRMGYFPSHGQRLSRPLERLVRIAQGAIGSRPPCSGTPPRPPFRSR